MEQDRLDEFMALVVGVSRCVTRLKSRHMSKYGLGSTHVMCIRKLYFSKAGLTRTQISDACELDKAQVSRIIGELTEKGFVSEGLGGSSYKRRVFLTAEGIRTAEEINGAVLRINTSVSESIPAEDIETFYKVFDRIYVNLKKEEENKEI